MLCGVQILGTSLFKKILKVFEGEDIRIDPTLQSKLPCYVIARSEETKQSQDNPSLAKRGEGRFYAFKGIVPDLRTCHGEPVEPAVIESGLSLTNYPYWFSASFPEERGIETP